MFSNKMIAGILIPVVLEQLLNSIMGTADTMMVSNIGSAAISAVSLVDSINILVIQAFSALAAGGAIVCSQYIGQQNKKMANESARQVLFIITAISIAVSVLCLGFKKPLLRLIFGSVEADVMRASETYFFYTAISFPFIAAYDSAASIFRAQENTKGPMLISMISNAMNIVGNAIMIWIFHMGVAGAAISTLVSRIFCAVVVLIQLRKDRQPIVVRAYLKICPDWAMIRRILGIGIPSGVENSMFQLGKLAIQSTVSTLGTTAIAAQAKDVNTIFGAMIVGGIVAIVVGLTIKQIRKVFPPLVIGTVIFAIGLSLYKTAINYMAGNSANTYEVIVEQRGQTAALVYGSWQNWLVSLVTLAIVIGLNHYGKGLFKLASILIGLVCGYVLALCFGMVDFSALSSAGWFQLPQPFAFGVKFDISAIIPLAILFLVNSIQAMGDLSATTSGGMDRLPTDQELNGGIIGYGISNIVSACFGCPPTATYSQNVGIVGSTKVVARKVFSLSAFILLIAGLIPKFSALLRTIPQCVLGGAVASVFAGIAMTGIKLLVSEGMSTRNTTVAGLSIAIGMGVSLSNGCLNQMTSTIYDGLGMTMGLENFQSIKAFFDMFHFK